jgi:serine/threonine protein kinase
MSSLPRSSSPPDVGTVLGDGYELVRFLGAGGVGVVYEALRADGRRVAVKVLLELGDGEDDPAHLVERFTRESSILGGLDSPHLVHVLDAGVDLRSGKPFLVMPLLEGLDLRTLGRKVGPLHPTLAARIARQACLGLQSAHAAGIVHRDIKPGNVFLDHDRQGNVIVRLVDFGVAKDSDRGGELTQTGTLVGTPRYMAPEQLENARLADARADVWGLGATLHHVLTGAVPFADCHGLGAVCYALANRGFPHVQDLAPWLDPALVAIIHGTLVPHPEARCPSAAALRDALEPFTGGSDELSSGMLQGVPAEVRRRPAERAVLPSSWQSVAPAQPTPGVPDSGRDPLLGTTIADRYLLLRRLGRGGMGAVYEAEDASRDRVAVKVLALVRAGTEPAALKRFLREARAVTTISSDHVVRVRDAGTDPESGLPYIVMERLQGVDLGALLDHQGPLAPQTAARVFIQACRGLAAAHVKGFVHRDIKPANLFLHELPSGEVVVKICDFGIVKRVRANEDEETTAQLTRTGGVVGSPAYMSPEQGKDARDINQTTDVWSLGISLFRTLTGSLPWAGRETVGELIVAICTEPMPHIQDLAPWIPPGLAEAVHRALRRSPADRYSSMIEFAVALEPFSGGSAALRVADLVPLDAALRSKADRRARLSEAVTGAGQTSGRSSIGRQPRSRTALAITAAALTLAAASAGLMWWSEWKRAASEPPPAGSGPGRSTTAGESAGSSAASFSVRVRVSPENAGVTVDGKAARLDGGLLTLAGVAGDVFAVVVGDGGRSVESRIVIMRDGTPSVDHIELTEPSPPGEASPRASMPAGKAKPARPGPTAGPSPSAVETATGTPTDMAKPKEDW